MKLLRKALPKSDVNILLNYKVYWGLA